MDRDDPVDNATNGLYLSQSSSSNEQLLNDESYLDKRQLSSLETSMSSSASLSNIDLSKSAAALITQNLVEEIRQAVNEAKGMVIF